MVVPQRGPLFFLPVAVAILVACAPTLSAPAAAQAPIEGVASWYGPGFAGRLTASGEVYDPGELTAAHQTLPFDTRVRVTNLNSGLAVVVRINDRGPFRAGRIIDLSRASAERIGLVATGVGPVRLEVLVADGTRTEIGQAMWLSGYDVISTEHPVGTLMVLDSGLGSDAVLVRVVSNVRPAQYHQSLLVAPALYEFLGASVVVTTE